jgi:hypothetical protein
LKKPVKNVIKFVYIQLSSKNNTSAKPVVRLVLPIKPVDVPKMYEMTNYASQQPFLQTAFNHFFDGISNYPQFKKKGHPTVLVMSKLRGVSK